MDGRRAVLISTAFCFSARNNMAMELANYGRSAGRQTRKMGGAVWLSFCALCVLLSSSWLLPFGATAVSSIEQQSCFYAAVGFVASAMSCPQLWARSKREKLFWLRLGGISILVLGLPAVMGEWARDAMSDVSRAALFALVPFI